MINSYTDLITVSEWEKNGLLSTLLTRLKELSALTFSEAIMQNQIKIYGNFPPNTDFFHPNHVPPDVSWGVLKSIGGQIGTIAGFRDGDIFYVVFLDSNHRFWITPKKNT